jgi:predicted O-methyltransferase YrrM
MAKRSALLHYIKVSLGFESAETQTTANEKKLIAEYSNGAKTAVELGVFEGVNTLTIAASLASDGSLYAVDPFTKGRLGLCYGKLICKSQLTKHKLQEKVKFLEMLSFDAVMHISEPIDFIFVDGDHSLDGVKRDWADWSPKVKKGGYIALHDTSVPKHDARVQELGSYQYFQSHISKDTRFKKVAEVDSLNILQKVL